MLAACQMTDVTIAFNDQRYDRRLLFIPALVAVACILASMLAGLPPSPPGCEPPHIENHDIPGRGPPFIITQIVSPATLTLGCFGSDAKHGVH